MKIKKFLVTCVAFASLSLVMADSAKSFANDTYLVTDKSDAVAVADISGEELDDCQRFARAMDSLDAGYFR